jgi:hypothetical protein
MLIFLKKNYRQAWQNLEKNVKETPDADGKDEIVFNFLDVFTAW